MWSFFSLSPTFIRCTLTSVVLYFAVKDDQKYVRKVVSVEYERPAIGQGYYVSFPVTDGQNLVSSYWALCYDWLNACPCGEPVSECFYSIYVYGEMERLQTEGRRMGMGSINAIVFSCGTITIYLTGVDVQRWLAVPTESKLPPFLLPTSPRMSLANWNAGINWMENHSSQTQIQFCFPDLQGSSDRVATWRDEGTEPGCGPCEHVAGHSKHQLAGKLTTNTYAWDDCQAEMNKHENEQIITSIYMQGEVTYIEKWHTAINTFCCLYWTVYNKKRSIYKNQYPLLLVNLIFLLLFLLIWNGAKTFLFLGRVGGRH